MSHRRKEKSTKSLHGFDMFLLDPVVLQSEDSFEGAISTLESYLQFLDDEKKARLLDDLLLVSNRLEFVFSGKSFPLFRMASLNFCHSNERRRRGLNHTLDTGIVPLATRYIHLFITSESTCSTLGLPLGISVDSQRDPLRRWHVSAMHPGVIRRVD